MRNAIPIGFIALVGILYTMKEKPAATGKTSKPAVRTQVRARVPARPAARIGRANTKQYNQKALMKKIRAMLAKRKQQAALRKKLAAAARPTPRRPLASTPPTKRLPLRIAPPVGGKPKIDRAALMKKIRAMLAKRRAQQAALKRAPVKAPTAPAAPAASATPGSIVELQTSAGNIQVKLFRKKAPITTANFLRYVRSGHYSGTIFHRVIPNFMIQGGGLTAAMKKKATSGNIRNEADNGLKNEIGTLAMARTGNPHSASAQFFINTKNNRFLNHRSKANGRTWGYAVFAKVIKGMDVVMKISGTPTATRSFRRNVPVTPIVIKKAVVIQ